MGYGGHLMWSAVARELKRKYPNKKIVFGFRPSLWDRLIGRPLHADVESEVFKNNPYLTSSKLINKQDDVTYVHLDSKENSYLSRCSKDSASFKEGGHVIDIICRNYGIPNPKKKCELYLTDKEKDEVAALVSGLGEFLTIEPHVKEEFTVNKGWGFNKWQSVVDDLRENWKVIQVGLANKPVLKGVIDMTGRLSFRQTSALIGNSRLFLTTEGGLMHAANAVGTRCVVIYGGYIPKELTSYDENINLSAVLPCSPCGLREPCPIDLECMREISPHMVIEAAKRILDQVPDKRHFRENSDVGVQYAK